MPNSFERTVQGLNGGGGFGNGLSGPAGLNTFGNGLNGNFGSGHLNGFENGNTAGLWYGYNQASQNPEFYQNGTAIPFSPQNSVSNLAQGTVQNTVPIQSLNSVETKVGHMLSTIPVTISTQQNLSAPSASNVTEMFKNVDPMISVNGNLKFFFEYCLFHQTHYLPTLCQSNFDVSFQ